MKAYLIACCLLALLCVGCDDLTRYSFDEPFPKRNIRLNRVLGDIITLKSGNDTLTLCIHSTKESNSLVDLATADTLFSGTISRYRGIYYFSSKNQDNTYEIYAVKIKDQLIYGLNAAFFQGVMIGELMNGGKHTDLVAKRKEKSVLLHGSKKQLRALFNEVLQAMPPDTILAREKSPEPGMAADTAEVMAAPDAEDLQTITGIFPNPVHDELSVRSTVAQSYTLYDQNLVSKLGGNLLQGKTMIDVSSLAPGIYYFQVSGGKETFRIIRQ